MAKDRLPQQDTRARRAGSQSAISTAVGGGMVITHPSSSIGIDLDDPNSGLSLSTDGLTALVQDVLSIDSSGILLNYSSGLYEDSSVLKVDHDAAVNFVADEHIDHTTVTMTAGNGLTGGGTIAATRTFTVQAQGVLDVDGSGVLLNFGEGLINNAGTLEVDSTSGETINLENPESALEFSSASETEGYRHFRLRIRDIYGVATANYPGTTGSATGFAEIVLASEVDGLNIMTDVSRITAPLAVVGTTAGMIDGDLAQGSGSHVWTCAWTGAERTIDYYFDAGNRHNPAYFGLTAYPTTSTSAAYRSIGHFTLEGSNDRANWTELLDESGITWTDDDIVDPLPLRWYALPGTSVTTLRVRIDPASPLSKETDGVSLAIGDGLDLGVATVSVSGVLGRYRLDDGTGIVAADTSGNSNDGDLEGTFAGGGGSGWDTDKPTTISSITGSLDFLGTSNAVSLGEPTEIDFDADVDEFTVMCWYKGTGSGSLIAKRSISTGNRMFQIYIAGGGVNVYVGGTQVTYSSTFFSLPAHVNPVDGDWHHVCVVNETVVGARRFHIYVDGYLIDRNNLTGSAQAPGIDWIIGARRNNNNTDWAYEYQGSICDVRFYDSPLDVDDIESIVAGNDISSPAPLLVDHNAATNFVANEHIDWTNATDNFLTTGNVTIDSDSSYLYLGGSQDATLRYDGTDMVIDTGVVNPSDLVVDCGTDKTLELQETVWKDINMGGAVLAGSPGQQPDRVDFVDETGTGTDITTYGIAVGEGVDGSFELQHDYKEGTDLSFHIHWQGIAAPTGTDKVQWQLTYAVAHSADTLNAATTITIETDFDTQYAFERSVFASITGTSYVVGDQFLFRLERIAASTDEYGGDALLATVGIHYEVDTLGSRQIGAK